MASRHLRCQCTECSAVFRMTRVWVDRAKALRCPVCGGPAVEGPSQVSDEDRASLRRACVEVATEAAAKHNERQLRRREVLRRRGGRRG